MQMYIGKYQCNRGASCTYDLPITISFLLNNSHTKKAYLLTKTFWRIFWKKKKLGVQTISRKNYEMESARGLGRKKKNKQERGIKWQPWHSRQVTSDTTSLPSANVKCKTTGSGRNILSLVCCHDNTHRTLPDYYCQCTLQCLFKIHTA